MDEQSTNPGKWTLSLYGQRPACPLRHLCVTCEKLLKLILWPRGKEQDAQGGEDNVGENDEQAFTIGWIDRMFSTKYCGLCQFFVTLFSRGGLDVAEFNEFDRVLCFMSFGDVKTLGGGLRLDWHLQVGFMRNEEIDQNEDERSLSQTTLPDARFNLNLDGLQRLLQAEIGEELETQKFHHLGRGVHDKISLEFLYESYRTCVQFHGDSCSRPRHLLRRDNADLKETGLSSIRVIDVYECCLVLLPKDANYVALSYTWSPEPFLSLTTNTFDQLHTRNSIVVANIPPTIADSMIVVSILGERYLWADRLCIMQDSGTDKATQITHMDKIYRYAALTIVAASSMPDGRDLGLPGIRPNTRIVDQVRTSVGNVDFIETNVHLEDAISRSRWNTRAWTFQEEILSHRHLVFTPKRCAWFCAKDTFAEDYIREVCCQPAAAGKNVREPWVEYTTPASTDDVVASGIASSVVAYEPMIRAYTQRNLTVPSDILNAVMGLLQVITRETGQRFLCGLPISHLLDHFLTWLPRSNSVRRKPGASGMPFPSWSWAGWIGPATYPLTGEFFDSKLDMSFSNEPMIENYTVLIPSSKVGSLGTPPEDIPDHDLLSLESCQLSFTASFAKVSMSTTFWGYFSDCESDDFGHASRCHQIFINGHFAGMLQPHLETDIASLREAEENLQFSDPSEPGQFKVVELIALSISYVPWAVYYPISEYVAEDVNYYYTDKDGEQKDHVPFNTEVFDDDSPSFVDVMLIEWQDGIAYRAGVGQVHIDAWNMAEPQSKKIVLQ